MKCIGCGKELELETEKGLGVCIDCFKDYYHHKKISWW